MLGTSQGERAVGDVEKGCAANTGDLEFTHKQARTDTKRAILLRSIWGSLLDDLILVDNKQELSVADLQKVLGYRATGTSFKKRSLNQQMNQ